MSLLKHFMQNTPTVSTKWEWDAFSFSSNSKNSNSKDGASKYDGDANTDILSDDVALKRMKDLASAKWDNAAQGNDNEEDAPSIDDGSVSVFSNATGASGGSGASKPISRRNRVSISQGSTCRRGSTIRRSSSIGGAARQRLPRNSSRSPAPPLGRSNTVTGATNNRRLRESKSLLGGGKDDIPAEEEEEIISGAAGSRRSFSPKRVSSLQQRTSSVRSRGMAGGPAGAPGAARSRSRSTSRPSKKPLPEDVSLDRASGHSCKSRARSKSRDGGPRRTQSKQQLDRTSSHSTNASGAAAAARSRSRSNSRLMDPVTVGRARSKSRDNAGGAASRRSQLDRASSHSSTKSGTPARSRSKTRESAIAGGGPRRPSSSRSRSRSTSTRGSRTASVDGSNGPTTTTTNNNNNNNKGDAAAKVPKIIKKKGGSGQQQNRMRKTKSMVAVNRSKSFDGPSASLHASSAHASSSTIGSSNKKVLRKTRSSSRNQRNQNWEATGSNKSAGPTSTTPEDSRPEDQEASEQQQQQLHESIADPSSLTVDLEDDTSSIASEEVEQDEEDSAYVEPEISPLLPTLTTTDEDDKHCDGLLDDEAADKEDAEALFIPRASLVAKLHQKWGSRPLAPPASRNSKDPSAIKSPTPHSKKNNPSATTTPTTAKAHFVPSSSLIEKLNQKWGHHPAAATVPAPALIEKLNERWGIKYLVPTTTTTSTDIGEETITSNDIHDASNNDTKQEEKGGFVPPDPLKDKLHQKWGIQSNDDDHTKRKVGEEDNAVSAEVAPSKTEEENRSIKKNETKDDYVPPSPLPTTTNKAPSSDDYVPPSPLVLDQQVQQSTTQKENKDGADTFDTTTSGSSTNKRSSKSKSPPREQLLQGEQKPSVRRLPKRSASSKLQRTSSSHRVSSRDEDKQGNTGLGPRPQGVKPTKKLPKRCVSEGGHRKPKQRCSSRSPKRTSSGDSTIPGNATTTARPAVALGGGSVHLPKNPPRMVMKRSRTVSEIQQARSGSKSPVRRSRTCEATNGTSTAGDAAAFPDLHKKKKPLPRSNSHASSLSGTGNKPTSRSRSLSNRKSLAVDNNKGVADATKSSTGTVAAATPTCNQTMSHAA